MKILNFSKFKIKGNADLSILAEGDIFQNGFSEVSGGRNKRCYISPEPGRAEFSDSTVRLYTGAHQFEL